MGDTAHRHIVFISTPTLFSSKNKGRCLALLLLKIFLSFFFENPKTYMYDEDPKLIQEKKKSLCLCLCFGFWTEEDSLKKKTHKTTLCE